MTHLFDYRNRALATIPFVLSPSLTFPSFIGFFLSTARREGERRLKTGMRQREAKLSSDPQPGDHCVQAAGVVARPPVVVCKMYVQFICVGRSASGCLYHIRLAYLF